MSPERTPEHPSRARLEVITGPMFCGKTDELIRRLRKAKVARLKIQVFKPSIDNRYSEEEIASHAGGRWPATLIESEDSKSIISKVDADTNLVAIDEAQFFDSDIVAVCNYLVEDGRRVLVAGLAADFRNEPFGSMGELLAVAEETRKLKAICLVCGGNAHFTQRLINGEPAPYDSDIVVVGGKELYEARCRDHYECPGHPKLK